MTSTLQFKASLHNKRKKPLLHVECGGVVNVNKKLAHSFGKVVCSNNNNTGSASGLLVTHGQNAVYLISPDARVDGIELVRFDANVRDVCLVADGQSRLHHLFVLAGSEIFRIAFTFHSTASRNKDLTPLSAHKEPLHPEEDIVVPLLDTTIGEVVRLSETASLPTRTYSSMSIRGNFIVRPPPFKIPESNNSTPETVFELSDLAKLSDLTVATNFITEKLATKTRDIIAKTGDRLKQYQQLQTSISTPNMIFTQLTEDDNDVCDGEEVVEAKYRLISVCEYLLSFERLDKGERSHNVERDLKEFCDRLHDLEKLADVNKYSNIARVMHYEEMTVLNELLGLVFRSNVMHLLKVKLTPPGKLNQDEEFAPAVKMARKFFPDTSHTDAQVISILRRFQAVTMPRILLDELPDGCFSSWLHLVRGDEHRIRERLSRISVSNRHAEMWQEAQTLLTRNTGNDGDSSGKVTLLGLAIFLAARLGAGAVGQLILFYGHSILKSLNFNDIFYLYLFLESLEEDSHVDVSPDLTGDAARDADGRNSYVSNASQMICAVLSEASLDAAKRNEMCKWLRTHSEILRLLKGFLSRRKENDLEDETIPSSLQHLNFVLVEVLPDDEGLSFCKECRFWPGYFKLLLRMKNSENLWDELPLLLRVGEAKLLTLLGFLGSDQDCASVLGVKAKIWQGDKTVDEVQVTWDDLGLEIIENLGVECGKQVFFDNGHLLPRGSFSPR